MAYSPELAESWAAARAEIGSANAATPLRSSNRPIVTLGPQNFQAILDLLDAFDLADGFLGHLLLKVRADRALEDDTAALGLEPEGAAVDIGVRLDGLIDPNGEGVFQGGRG